MKRDWNLRAEIVDPTYVWIVGDLFDEHQQSADIPDLIQVAIIGPSRTKSDPSAAAIFIERRELARFLFAGWRKQSRSADRRSGRMTTVAIPVERRELGAIRG